MNHCHRHAAFNSGCRDCMRKKYEHDDNDSTGFSHNEDSISVGLVAGEMINTALDMEQSGVSAPDPSPSADFGNSGGAFDGGGSGGDW